MGDTGDFRVGEIGSVSGESEWNDPRCRVGNVRGDGRLGPPEDDDIFEFQLRYAIDGEPETDL